MGDVKISNNAKQDHDVEPTNKRSTEVSRIIYLHGLNSSPASAKAQQLQAAMAARGLEDHLLVPQLPHQPARAIRLIERQMAALGDNVTLVGSSLGGFYATFLAETLEVRAVLINPAVDAPRLVHSYLGPQRNLYTGEEYSLTEAHEADLKVIDIARITRPERYLLMVETGDEVLSWQRAVHKFPGAQHIVVQGGNHNFASFAQYIPTILTFAGLPDSV